MKRPLTAIALCAAAALSAQVALANDHEHHQTSNSETKDLSSPHKEFKSAIRASQLMGINVTSKDGDNLGQVQDLVINPQNGKVKFALVGKGFMAGAGETMFPVPWRAVNVKSERNFVLNVDQQKLRSAPMWSQTQIDQPDYVLRIYRFYAIPEDSDNTQMGTSGESIQGQGAGSSDLNHSQSDLQQREPASSPDTSRKDNQQNDHTGIAPKDSSSSQSSSSSPQK